MIACTAFIELGNKVALPDAQFRRQHHLTLIVQLCGLQGLTGSRRFCYFQSGCIISLALVEDVGQVGLGNFAVLSTSGRCISIHWRYLV